MREVAIMRFSDDVLLEDRKRHMISFNRPAMGMPSAAVGVTVSGRPSGLASFPSGSMPINS